KIMKKFLIGLLVLMFAVAVVDAGPKRKAIRKKAVRKAVVKQRAINNVAAKRVIRRTALVIRKAHQLVKQNKNYTGHLARAIRQQKFARILFAKKMFLQSARHSIRARRLALQAIALNKGTPPKEGTLDKEETNLMADAPKDEEMDKEAEKEMPDESIKDENFLEDLPALEAEEEK
ncbi:MAG: hypothetical protein JW827_12715, partial [Spirochaetes bacterium]|nr:hypothetical protein [Spirochaetota bacterium]